MKKRFSLSLLTVTMIGIGTAQAQKLSDYVVTTDTAEYVSIYSPSRYTTFITMPFDFPLGGRVIPQGTSIYPRKSYILFNVGFIASACYGSYWYDHFSQNAAIVPFMKSCPLASGGACYAMTDTDDAGTSVLVMEFQHLSHQNYSNPDDFNYQLRLYEDGRVSVHFGHMQSGQQNYDYNFFLVAGLADSAERVILNGTWDSPTAMLASFIWQAQMSGFPDSGLVVTLNPPPPCISPADLNISELTPYSGMLTWPGSGRENALYAVQYDSIDFLPGNENQHNYSLTSDTSQAITLMPNTRYYAYVATRCGSVTGQWQRLTFLTPCIPMSHTDLPFTEDFQSYTGNSVSSVDSTLFVPGCWRRSNRNITVLEIVASQRQLSLPVYGSSMSGMGDPVVLAALPPIDILADLEISFDVSFSPSGSGTRFEVGVLDDAGDPSSFVPVCSIPNGTWVGRSVRLSSYSGPGNMIAMRFGVGYANYARALVDNINVHVVTSCPAVDSLTIGNVTATSIRVGWVDLDYVGHYRVVYYPTGYPNLADSVEVNTTRAIITGLTPETGYTVKVYAFCPGFGVGSPTTVTATTLPTCAPPTAVQIASIGGTSATVRWVEPNEVGAYHILCTGTGYSLSDTVTLDTSLMLTGLTPSTTYTVTVRRLCTNPATGLADSATAALATTFTTAPCYPAALPWSEGFETWAFETLNNCWQGYATQSGQNLYSSNFMAHAGNRGLYFRAVKNNSQGTHYRTVAVLPEFEVPVNRLVVSFYVFSDDHGFEIGVVSDAADTTTFVAIDTVRPSGTSWGYCEYDFSNYTGSDAGVSPYGRVAFRYSVRGSSASSNAIDDITVIRLPACPHPAAVIIDSVTATSISLTVDDPDSAGHYRAWVYSGEMATTGPGAGTLIDSVDFEGNSYTVTGLPHFPIYTVSVAAICMADSSITAAVSATACGVVTHSDLPYTENFDNSLNGCTSFIDHSDWQGDHITPAYYRGTSGKSLYPTADNDSVPFFFILPRIDTTARVALSFWSRCTHHDFNKFTVGLMTDPSDTSTFTPVQTVYPTVDNDWEEIRVSLGYYAGSSLHPAIRFGAHGGEHAWTVNVDDITLIEDLSCLPPDSVTLLAVTDTTATLLVHDPRGAGHYRIRMAGDSVDYFSDTILLTGLTHATDYTLSLSAVCTGGAATHPLSLSFVTACGVYTLPYFENFNSTPSSRLPYCWQVVDTASVGPSVYSYNDRKYILGSLNLSALSNRVTFATPLFHVVDTDIFITFHAQTGQSYYDNAQLRYLPLQYQVYYLDTLWDQPRLIRQDTISSASHDENWEQIHFSTPLIPSGTGSLLFAFLRDTATLFSHSFAFAFDSLSVVSVHHDPPCFPVRELQVDYVSITTAQAQWLRGNIETSWQMHLFGGIEDTLIHVGSDFGLDTVTVPLTGLQPGWNYSLAVRPICTDSLVEWSDTVTFTTASCPVPDNVVATQVTDHSIQVEWNSPTNGPWQVAYGYEGFTQGNGELGLMPVQAGGGHAAVTIFGLAPATAYDIYIRTLCDENVHSLWSDKLTVTTTLNSQISILKSQFSISPNPANTHFTIHGIDTHGAYGVIIRDTHGRTLLNTQLSILNSQISIPNFPSGIYYVTVTTPTSTVTRKLTVVK